MLVIYGGTLMMVRACFQLPDHCWSAEYEKNFERFRARLGRIWKKGMKNSY